MYRSQPGPPSFGSFGPSGPPPRDLLVVLGVLFVTFSLQFFESTAILPALLRLTPAVWQAGFLWQLATYAFVGFGAPSLWILLELFILYWFGTEVYRILGRRFFWRLLAWAVVGAAVVAVAAHLLGALVWGPLTGYPFQIIQGQRILLVVVIAAFAVLRRDATILLFFVLPIRAWYFFWLEIVIAFVAFLGSRDLGGFAGVCAASAITYAFLTGRGPRTLLRRARLRLQAKQLERRIDRARRKRRLRVVGEDDERVH